MSSHGGHGHGRWATTLAPSPTTPTAPYHNGGSGSSSGGGRASSDLSTSMSMSELLARGAGGAGEQLDAMQEHYVSAYSAAELKTFHCERVRKMPLSGLDPSMLLGFLCRDEADWEDFKGRVADVSLSLRFSHFVVVSLLF